MNNYNFIAIMGIAVALSLAVGVAAPVFAASHENATMTMDNMTAGMDNMTDNATMPTINEIPSDNTSMLTDTDMGLDGNQLAGQ